MEQLPHIPRASELRSWISLEEGMRRVSALLLDQMGVKVKLSCRRKLLPKEQKKLIETKKNIESLLELQRFLIKLYVQRKRGCPFAVVPADRFYQIIDEKI